MYKRQDLVTLDRPNATYPIDGIYNGEQPSNDEDGPSTLSLIHIFMKDHPEAIAEAIAEGVKAYSKL